MRSIDPTDDIGSQLPPDYAIESCVCNALWLASLHAAAGDQVESDDCLADALVMIEEKWVMALAS